jgi:hypothetical protein
MMRETRFPVSPKERQAVRQAAAYRGWEKRRERDEAVTVNLPADMLPLWERTKAQFKGTPDERRDAFLQFAHDQGDGAVIEALIDASEARLTGMLREYRSRFAGETGDAGDVSDASADAGAGIVYEAGLAGWLAEVGIGGADACEDGTAALAGADAGADVTLLDFDADEVTAVMARPVLAAALAGADAGADVTLLDFDADAVIAVRARPVLAGAGAGAGAGAVAGAGAWLAGATLADLDGVIVLGADDADVTIVDAV